MKTLDRYGQYFTVRATFPRGPFDPLAALLLLVEGFVVAMLSFKAIYERFVVCAVMRICSVAFTFVFDDIKT
jgi:hypothetical protein